jgi:hypothetical protein
MASSLGSGDHTNHAVFPDSMQILHPKIFWKNYRHNALRLPQDFIPKKSTGSTEFYADTIKAIEQNTKYKILIRGFILFQDIPIHKSWKIQTTV